MKAVSAVFFFILFSIFILGCGQKLPDGMPKLSPCSAIFVQNGQPLTEANIDLLLLEGNTKWNISGTTDAAGRVEFMTNGLYRGAPKGEYKVVVTKRENGAKDAKGYTLIFSIVEKKYTDPSSTDLKMTVDGKSGEVKFDLGKPVKIQVDRLEPASNARG